jgi:hypothetical protein
MGKSKIKTCRISISILFIASLLFSGFSTAPLRADADESEKRTSLILDAGLIQTDEKSSIFRITNKGWYQCSQSEGGVSPLSMLMAECLEDPNLDLMISNSLGPCNTDITIPCIEEVFARNPNTDWLRGNFSRYLDNDHFASFGAMPQYQTGEQHDRNLYTFPGLTNDPSQLFVIQPLLKTKVVRKVLDGAYQLKVALHAIKRIPDWVIGRNVAENPLFYSSSEEYEKDLLTCTFMEDSISGCWDYVSNPLSNQFKLVLRLPSVPNGWLTGRLYSPDIKFKFIPGAAQPYRVTLIGSPIPTPGITKVYFSDDLEDRSTCNIILKEQKRSGSCFETNSKNSIHYSGITEYQNLKNKIPELDIATKIIDDWQIFMFFPDKKNPKSSGFCDSDQFNGFVSSNALTYDQYPKFDVALKSLDYTVGGPHFMPDKSVFSGLYSMILTRDYAKCIWGLSSPVFNASVQVVDQDGVVSTAVTTIGVDDEFIRFSATGFTFSTKIMKVKFFKTKKELDQSKKKIITCVKNKKVSRFVGVASCPKGFKVKK